jgi:hypothetical protein
VNAPPFLLAPDFSAASSSAFATRLGTLLRETFSTTLTRLRILCGPARGRVLTTVEDRELSDTLDGSFGMEHLFPAIGCGAIDLDPALHQEINPSGRLSLSKEDAPGWSRAVDHPSRDQVEGFLRQIPEEGYPPQLFSRIPNHQRHPYVASHQPVIFVTVRCGYPAQF